jgi:hypothetical protein
MGRKWDGTEAVPPLNDQRNLFVFSWYMPLEFSSLTAETQFAEFFRLTGASPLREFFSKASYQNSISSEKYASRIPACIMNLNT